MSTSASRPASSATGSASGRCVVAGAGAAPPLARCSIGGGGGPEVGPGPEGRRMHDGEET
eukprot:5365014-Pyramimonas_sp.AAC.1